MNKSIFAPPATTLAFRYNTLPEVFWVELVLWILFILPGVLYSLYRMLSKKQVCTVCGSAIIIPVDSPKGKELIQQ